MTATVYDASAVKRHRRTNAEMAEFNRAIWDVCAANRPLSARQCYYRAVVAGLVDKDQAGSRKNEERVGYALDTMRERGVELYHQPYVYGSGGANIADDVLRRNLVVPFPWITDSTRTRYQADLYGSKADALRDMAAYYRRDLWRSQPRHVELWCESESIAGTLMGTTQYFGVALLPCRGQSGKRFVWDSAQSYARLGKPVVCLYVGDFDPAGLDISNSLESRLDRYGADAVEFDRIAVTPEQVDEMELPGHGLNPNIAESVRRRFTDVCDQHGIAREAVEAEAMPPNELRGLVRDAISRHINRQQWDLEMAVEAEERRGLEALASGGEMLARSWPGPPSKR